MIEMHCREIYTEGRALTFRVYKKHGQTPRLQIQQAVRPGVIGQLIEESLTICEEDVADFLGGVLEAVEALGVSPVAKRSQTEEERYEEIRKRHPNAYRGWTELEDAQLTQEVADGLKRREIAIRHGRNLGAIESRIRKLGLEGDGA